MKKVVLFDMDGVIIDSERGAFDFICNALWQNGIHIPKTQLMSKIGKTSKMIATEITKEYHLNTTPDETLRIIRSCGNYYRDSERLIIMDDLFRFCDLLVKKDIKIGVVSSTSAMSAMTALNRIGFVKYCDTILCGDMMPHPKPAPDGYLLAAKWIGATPEDCVIIEDSPIGIEAAKRAGIKVVGFTGSEIEQDVSSADLQMQNYSECISEIDKILK